MSGPPEGFEPNDFRIPTLDEVLTAFPDTLINIELKQSNSTGRFEMAVADLLRKHGRVDDVIVVSFLDHSLEVFKALAPDVHTATATGNAGRVLGELAGPACRVRRTRATWRFRCPRTSAASR